ncbi:MAG: helix-hairpin-helix domain-containing protein [Proteobacteria bacterium]|nr:helix-hairpin-helix domain-containing protein [Pseudomonadota bacterium]
MRLAHPPLWRALCVCALLHAGAALAAVDVNLAREADLDGVKGIGPALSARILAERAKGRFLDWRDLFTRVKGIGPAAAARLSANGLTVDGAGYAPPGAAPTPPASH